MKTETSPVNTAQMFIAAAGGLALYLGPQDAKNMFAASQRVSYVIAISALVAVVLLLLFRNYETVGISLIVTMAIVVVNYIRCSAGSVLADMGEGKSFSLYLSYDDGLNWGLIWFVPFVICLVVRLTATGKWDMPERRQSFCRFYKLAVRAFYVYYTILFLVCFFFIHRVGLYSVRSVNLIPIRNMANNFANWQAGIYFLAGNLFFFIPLGFFFSVHKPNMLWWKRLAAVAAFSLAVESIQYAFNTGYADVDDVWLSIAGLFIGILLKTALDKIRSFITGGEEKSIAYLC